MSTAKSFVAFVAILSVSTASQGQALWDESVGGDLPNTLASARDLGTLRIGSSEIVGHVDTNQLVDPVDFVRITTTGPLTIDLASVSLGLQATGFGGLLYINADDVVDRVDISAVPKNNLFGGTLEPGTYRIRASTVGTIGSLDYTLRFNVGPPDPAKLLEKLVSSLVAMNISGGISNALDSKLQNALDALDRAQAGDNAAASGIMGAFIQSVEAQRGKKLTEAQADELVIAAEAVIAAL
jgi:hypothetical protein